MGNHGYLCGRFFFLWGGQETCWSHLHYRFDPLRNLRTRDEAKERLRSGLVVYNSQFRNTNAFWSVIGNDHILVVRVDISWTMFKSYWCVCYLPSVEHNCETTHALILLGPYSFTSNKKQNIHLKNYELFLLLNLSVSIYKRQTYIFRFMAKSFGIAVSPNALRTTHAPFHQISSSQL